MHEILRSLGRIEGDIKTLRADIEHIREDVNEGKDGRGRIHSKMERIEQTLAEVHQIAAQARDSAASVSKVVREDVKPATDDFKRMRVIGFTGLSLLGFAFTALGVSISNWSEHAANAIKAWLRIN